ncbi:MAG: metal-dependent transcriptional regulator [Candidatus Heimdallarchaeaceae archaeon]
MNGKESNHKKRFNGNLSATAEEYLETLYWFFEYGNQHVKTNQLAEMMNVHPSTATSMLKKLKKQGLIEYRPYYGAHLTKKGQRLARNVVRKHRIAESFLSWLGIPWAKIHEEACKWEHVLSDELIEKLEQKIPLPSKTPYGAFIPSKDTDEIFKYEKQPMAFFHQGDTIEVVEILERAIARHFQKSRISLTEVYEELEKLNLIPGSRLVIIDTFQSTEIKIERWSHQYAVNMKVKDSKGNIVDIPYYFVSMVLAKKVE